MRSIVSLTVRHEPLTACYCNLCDLLTLTLTLTLTDATMVLLMPPFFVSLPSICKDTLSRLCLHDIHSRGDLLSRAGNRPCRWVPPKTFELSLSVKRIVARVLHINFVDITLMKVTPYEMLSSMVTVRSWQ